MNAIRKFARLNTHERRLILRTMAILLWVRLTLRLIPIRWMYRVRPRRPGPPTAETTDRLLWSVTCAGRWIPGLTCLVQAFALHLLMAGEGRESRVQVGFTNRNGALEAHAWVESEGQILLGGPDVARYRPLFPSRQGLHEPRV